MVASKTLTSKVARWIHSLGARFNAPQSAADPKVADDLTGFFGNPLLPNSGDFSLLNKVVRANSENIVSKILSRDRTKRPVGLIDDLSNVICKGADAVECIRWLHPDPRVVDAATRSMADFTDLVESLNTRTDIYRVLKGSMRTDVARHDAVDSRVAGLLLADFEASGVHLPADKRQLFVELSNEIFLLGAEFSRRADEPTLLSKASVPAAARRRLSPTDDGEQVVLTSPLSSEKDAETRRWAYRTYYARNAEQEATLKQLVDCRARLATLTGFSTYADRAQMHSMLGSAEKAEDFLKAVLRDLRAPAEREWHALSSFGADSLDLARGLDVADVDFAKSHYRSQKWRLSGEYAPYFSIGKLIEGLSQLCTELYGIRLCVEEAAAGEVWCESVIKLVAQADATPLGVIYCDLWAREGKSGGDCHYTVQCAKTLDDGTQQLPVVVLALSLPPPRADRPSLLTPSQAENLFHEMGHALHSVLGSTRYQHVAGTRCPTDLAEIPSNLMEYFLNDSRVLSSVARHYADGKPLPEDMADCLASSQAAFGALEHSHQACSALFDLRLHGSATALQFQSSSQLLDEIHTRSLPFACSASETATQHRFGHLVPYGAKYYSYLVARASAALIWKRLFHEDPTSRRAGDLWRAFQSSGGEQPALSMLARILGFVPSIGDLVGALQEEVESARL